MDEYKMRYRIATIYTLISAAESELTALNPIKTLNNNNASLEFQSTLNRITRLRKFMDEYLGEHAEGWGDCSDEIIEIIEKHIKKVETAELAAQNETNEI